MLQYLIMCRSLTYAQRSARALERAGITAVVTRAPQGAATNGCAYCVKLSERRMPDALRVLKNTGLSPGRILLYQKDHSFREVHDFE